MDNTWKQEFDSLPHLQDTYMYMAFGGYMVCINMGRYILFIQFEEWIRTLFRGAYLSDELVCVCILLNGMCCTDFCFDKTCCTLII